MSDLAKLDIELENLEKQWGPRKSPRKSQSPRKPRKSLEEWQKQILAPLEDLAPLKDHDEVKEVCAAFLLETMQIPRATTIRWTIKNKKNTYTECQNLPNVSQICKRYMKKNGFTDEQVRHSLENMLKAGKSTNEMLEHCKTQVSEKLARARRFPPKVPKLKLPPPISPSKRLPPPSPPNRPRSHKKPTQPPIPPKPLIPPPKPSKRRQYKRPPLRTPPPLPPKPPKRRNSPSPKKPTRPPPPFPTRKEQQQGSGRKKTLPKRQTKNAEEEKNNAVYWGKHQKVHQCLLPQMI